MNCLITVFTQPPFHRLRLTDRHTVHHQHRALSFYVSLISWNWMQNTSMERFKEQALGFLQTAKSQCAPHFSFVTVAYILEKLMFVLVLSISFGLIELQGCLYILAHWKMVALITNSCVRICDSWIILFIDGLWKLYIQHTHIWTRWAFIFGSCWMRLPIHLSWRATTNRSHTPAPATNRTNTQSF